MRRSLFKLLSSLAFAGTLACAAPLQLLAQSGIETSAAPELISPTGARSVAMGQATIADPGGTESVWSNPALLAWSTRRELAAHFTKTIAANDNLASFLLPFAPVGVVGISGRLFDYGEQSTTPLTDTTTTGTISNRMYIWVVSFASTIGDRVAVGVNYKIVQAVNSCVTGDCTQAPLNSGGTSAIDVGAHYRLSTKQPVSVAATLQNVGPALQYHDSPQRDPLPALMSVGASWTPAITSLPADAEVHMDGAAVARLNGMGTPGLRFGGELAWQKKLQVRAGYALYGPSGSGPSAGLGVNTGRLQVDIARMFTDLLSESGQTSTYVSLRFQF